MMCFINQSFSVVQKDVFFSVIFFHSLQQVFFTLNKFGDFGIYDAVAEVI